MKDFLTNSTFFYVFLTLITYQLGVALKNKFKMAIFNPLMISTIICITVLLIFKLDVASYRLIPPGLYIYDREQNFFPSCLHLLQSVLQFRSMNSSKN